MKRMLVTAGMVAVCATAAAANWTQEQKLGYAMGLETGQAFRAHKLKLDPASFSQGLTAGMKGTQPALTTAEMNEAIQTYRKEARAKEVSLHEAELKKARLLTKKHKGKKVADQHAKDFLAENKTKPGVVALPNGLQYKILTKGTGEKPSATDRVTVDYEGMLTDGKVFDSSYKRGQPATFGLNQVIKGWTEGLQLMRTGATWMLYIPSDMAYGPTGMGSVIPPNATLIFKVHLIKIQS